MTTHTAAPAERATHIRALLFDRDGTLVIDVPYNADPGRVRPMPCALAAVPERALTSRTMGGMSR